MRVTAARTMFGTATGVALALVATPAAAQTEPQAQPADSSTPASATSNPQVDGGFGDILVTARRREERLQDVPIAVSAIAGGDLAAKSVVQLSDLSKSIPALAITPGGFGSAVPRFTIRSQTQFEQLLTLDPSVGVYFADVVQARAHGVNAGFFDLASVEVLKGPQGTLFGRNTTGGAIVVTPRAPTNELGGYLRVTLGNYATRYFEGALNVPISDTLSLRVAGRIADRDGYTYNPYVDRRFDDEHTQSWRASLLYTPSDAVTNLTVVNGFRVNEQGPGWRLTGVYPGSLIARARPDVFTFLTQAGDRRIGGSDMTNKQTDAKAWGVSNTTTVDLGGVTLKNIFGYRKVESTNWLDFDGSPLAVWPSVETMRADQYSNELQLLGTAMADRLNWIVGGYWFRENGEDTQRTTITLPPLFNQDTIRTGFATNGSKSVFAQGTYKFGFLDGLSATAGVRYTWDDRRFREVGVNMLNGLCSIVTAANVPIAQPCSKEVSADFKAPTYTLSLDWKFAQDKLVYIAHRRGYHAGGFNLRANTPDQFLPFNPEVVQDVEVGIKADWMIGGTRLRTNLAAYYQDYSDIQRSITVPLNGVLLTSIVNAATAHITGFEAEVRWLPTPNLEISGFAAHSKFTYDKFQQTLAGGVIQDLRNNKIAFAPEWSGGGSIRFSLPLAGDGGTVVAQADAYAQSQIELQDLNVPNGTAAAYTIANFRLEWNEFLGSRMSTALYLRNVFDKQYFNSGIAVNGVGVITKTYGAPRTVGIELNIPFGN